MFQWTGGSRKKVNTKRKSTEIKQKQYFEQRRRQQQTHGLANQSSFYNNHNINNNSEPKSLDILNFIELASLAQNKDHNHNHAPKDNNTPRVEHKNNNPKISTPSILKKFINSQANNDLPKLSPSMEVKKSINIGCNQGTSSLHEAFGTQKAVPVRNCKEKVDIFENLPSSSNSFNSKLPDSRPKKQSDTQSEVSVLDLLRDDDLKRNHVHKSGHESHVAFSIKGLGRVEAETPPHSPIRYQRIFPEPPHKATRSNKSKIFQPVSFGSKFELDPIMRDINVGKFEGILDELVYKEEQRQFQNSYYPNSNIFQDLESNFRPKSYGRPRDEHEYKKSWKGSYDENDFEGFLDKQAYEEEEEELQFENSNYHKSNSFQNLRNDLESEPYGDKYKYNRNLKGSNGKKIMTNSPGKKYDKMLETNLFNSEDFYAISPKNNNKFESGLLDSAFDEDHGFPSMRTGVKAKRRLDLNTAKCGPSCSSVDFDWERNSPKLRRKSDYNGSFSRPVWSFKEDLNDLQDSTSLRSEESCASTKVKDVKSFNLHPQASKFKESCMDDFSLNFDLNFETPKFVDDLTSQTWEEKKFSNLSRTKPQKTSYSVDDKFLDCNLPPKGNNLLDSFPDHKTYKITNNPSKSDTIEQRPNLEENSDTFNKLEREGSKGKKENSAEVGSNKVKKDECREFEGLKNESEKISGMGENVEHNEINEGAFVVVPESPLRILPFDGADNNTLKTPVQSQPSEQCNLVEEDMNRTPPVPSQAGASDEENGRRYNLMLQSYVLQLLCVQTVFLEASQKDKNK